MGRRVAIAGAALVTAGLALQWWVQPPPPRGAAATPLDQLVSLLVALLPALGAAITAVGAVVLALAILSALGASLHLRGHHPGVLWSGIGLVLLSIAAEPVLLSGPVLDAFSAGSRDVVLVLLQVAAVVRLIGAALLAVWLVAVVTEPRAGRPQQAAAAQHPSRPF